MNTTTSKDGTTIAYDVVGSGPAVVLVDGALCRRAFGPMADLAEALSSRFTVLYYDRRGRGESGDTAPYAPEKELDDLDAVVACAGSDVCVYGTSSGAAIAMRAVGRGLRVRKLALYEAPFALDGTHTPTPADFRERIGAMVEAGRRDDAAKLFLRVVGVPAFGVFFMRLMPNVWPKLRASAHTLPYDFAQLGDTQRGGPLPPDLVSALAAISCPTLAMAGGKSPPWMHHAGKTIAGAVRAGSFRVVPGQDHAASARAIAPVLTELFAP